MKKSEFKLSSKEAEKGILKLKRDIPVAANWIREKVAKQQLEAESRKSRHENWDKAMRSDNWDKPMSSPDTKYFDGHKYTFYGMVSDKEKAQYLADKIRKTGRYARIEPGWIVWRGAQYKK